MPPPGSARNSAMSPSPMATAVTCPPGAVLPSETLDHGPQAPPASRDVVYTPPLGSARNSAMRPGAVTTALIGPPGSVRPCDTLAHGLQPRSGVPDAENT